MLLTEGQRSDHKGAGILLPALPDACHLIADKGYDRDRLRKALAARGITACIPSTKARKRRLSHDGHLYGQRHTIENLLGKPKDWRRSATRFDRCAHAFFSAIFLAATFIFWLL